MSVEEHYEQLLAFISTHIPTPFTQEDIEGAVIFTGGSPAEVVVRLTDTAVIVEEYAVRWEALYTPVRAAATSRDREVAQAPRVAADDRGRRVDQGRTRHAALQATAPARSAARPTRRSGWPTDTTCRSCAKQELGVVH